MTARWFAGSERQRRWVFDPGGDGGEGSCYCIVGSVVRFRWRKWGKMFDGYWDVGDDSNVVGEEIVGFFFCLPTSQLEMADFNGGWQSLSPSSPELRTATFGMKSGRLVFAIQRTPFIAPDRTKSPAPFILSKFINHVLLYRAGLVTVASSFVIGAASAFLPEDSFLMSIVKQNIDVLYAIGAGGLGLSLFLIHIYVTPIKRTLQSLWSIGAVGSLATYLNLAKPSSESLVQYVVHNPVAVWFIGPLFASLTGLVFKEGRRESQRTGLCYGKLEAGILTFIIPTVLLGHLYSMHESMNWWEQYSCIWGYSSGIAVYMEGESKTMEKKKDLMKAAFCGMYVLEPNFHGIINSGDDSFAHYVLLSTVTYDSHVYNLQSGLMDDNAKLSLLGAWMVLFIIFAARKFTQPIKDDIGDKSVFMFNALPEEEKQALIEQLERQFGQDLN
ncbi:hypothetical protein ACLOJK_019508 [Asimina triloba]